MASSRALRKRLRQELAGPGWRELGQELAQDPGQGVVTALLASLAGDSDVKRKRAAAVLGTVAASLVERDPEAGREVMRRLVWSLNEESGAVPWGAPEAMAEVMAASPLMAAEFSRLLVSYVSPCENQLEFEPLLAGALWGLGRLARAQPQVMAKALPGSQAGEALSPHLSHPDPMVRGHAVWALARLEPNHPALTALAGDSARFGLCQDGEVAHVTVAQAAQGGMARPSDKGTMYSKSR